MVVQPSAMAVAVPARLWLKTAKPTHIHTSCGTNCFTYAAYLR
jgi:hypothetical protein